MRPVLDFKNETDREQVKAHALHFGLEPALVAAFVMQESGGKPDAWNPEPRYQWFWDVRQQKPFRKVTQAEITSKFPPADFPCLAGDRDQEWWGQQASWGLLQLMGAAARETGCRLEYLTGLCDPTEGLKWGCQWLARLVNRFAAGAVSAYNAGHPVPGSPYEVSVLQWRDKMRLLFGST
jgi:hypothetical protein